jgi:hypothetical protein
MRTATIQAIATAMFVSTAAVASDVRHSGFPESVVGVWAPSPQACNDAAKSAVTLSAKTYVSSETICAVDWVNETASALGPDYSAHMQCSKPSDPAQKVVSNLIIRPKDNSQISVGPDFENLKVYQRCSTK